MPWRVYFKLKMLKRKRIIKMFILTTMKVSKPSTLLTWKMVLFSRIINVWISLTGTVLCMTFHFMSLLVTTRRQKSLSTLKNVMGISDSLPDIRSTIRSISDEGSTQQSLLLWVYPSLTKKTTLNYGTICFEYCSNHSSPLMRSN